MVEAEDTGLEAAKKKKEKKNSYIIEIHCPSEKCFPYPE